MNDRDLIVEGISVTNALASGTVRLTGLFWGGVLVTSQNGCKFARLNSGPVFALIKLATHLPLVDPDRNRSI